MIAWPSFEAKDESQFEKRVLAKRLETREWSTVDSIVVFTFNSVVLLIGDEAVEDAGVSIHQRNVSARLGLKNLLLLSLLTATP